jgi:hypothetical protein
MDTVSGTTAAAVPTNKSRQIIIKIPELALMKPSQKYQLNIINPL